MNRKDLLDLIESLGVVQSAADLLTFGTNRDPESFIQMIKRNSERAMEIAKRNLEPGEYASNYASAKARDLRAAGHEH